MLVSVLLYMASGTELAWAAGIVDGEGCIGIYSQAKHKSNYVSYQLQVQVSMSDAHTVQRFADIVGLKVYPRLNRDKKMFVAVAFSKNAERVIGLLLPYLVTKRRQARIGLMFRSTFDGCTNKVPPQSLEIRKRCKLLIARAKHRPR